MAYIKQDQLDYIDTGVTFSSIYHVNTRRLVHNGSDIIRFRTQDSSGILTYFTTAGQLASSYAMGEEDIFDISYERTQNRYYQVRYNEDYTTLTLDRIDNEGQVISNIVNRLDILPYSGSYSDFSGLGLITLAVDDNNGAFVKVLDDVYRVNIAGSYNPSVYYDETSPEIAVSSGVIPISGVASFQFNPTAGKFLQYITYDDNTEETMLKTLDITGSGSPSLSDRQVFLEADLPSWNNAFTHGVDYTTLYYFESTSLKRFNVDSSLSAFASINVDDASLRAGTSDTTTVRAEVINAWGDALEGKTVNFIVSQGDGVVSPSSDTTDVNGRATTTYQVGVTPGAVEITAIISD
jgi:hypothetical protein